ncbi:MAG: outer membrane protein assembly factor BamB family protein [Candidatus Helarchaeota archaeon]
MVKKRKKPYWRLDEKAFWPCLRADYRNTGRAPNWDDNRFNKDIKWPEQPWAFKMGKAITASPVIGADGTIYIGSSDTYFYAIKPDGTLKWKLKTPMVIDDAAVIGRRTDPDTGEERDYVFFPGADGIARKVDCQTGKVVGMFEAKDHYKKPNGEPILANGVPKCNWFESDFTFSKSGRLLAGCDDFAFYQLDPETMKRAAPEYMAWNQIWSGSPTGFEPEGDHYFGCLDSIFRSIDEQGRLRWFYPIFGMAGASPTILDDGSVVIGSGNNNIYCFRSKGTFFKLGRIKWKFHTKSDVWSSAAVSYDGLRVYVSSSDGVVYALHAETGQLIWSFPTLGPNRCGCVLDREGDVYIASGDGKIYKLSGKDGHRIWSFDCRTFNTSKELGEWDRCHFVPSSIALSPGGVFAPNQNGNLYYIPFTFMESEAARQDSRCSFNPKPDLPPDGEYLVPVSVGGNLLIDELSISGNEPPQILAKSPRGRSDTIFLGVLVTKNWQIQDARLENVVVISDIPFKRHVQISTDRRYVNIVPLQFLSPGQKYNLHIKCEYIIPKKYGWGLLALDRHWRGKKVKRSFEIIYSFETIHTKPFLGENEPLFQPSKVGSQQLGDILVLKNIFPWQEALIINLTIIALDDVYIIANPIYHDPQKKRIVFWCILGEKIKGIEHDSDPKYASYKVVSQPWSTPFRFPLDMIYDRDGTFSIFTSGFRLDWAGVAMPFRMLKIAGKYDKKKELQTGGTAYFETPISEIPLFGRVLQLMNVQNKNKNFMTAGTYRLELAKGPVMTPIKAEVKEIELRKSEIHVHFKTNPPISLKDHFVNVALINIETGKSIKQDYQSNISFIEDQNGYVLRVIQKLEKKQVKKLIQQKKCLCMVLVDTTPIYKQIL